MHTSLVGIFPEDMFDAYNYVIYGILAEIASSYQIKLPHHFPQFCLSCYYDFPLIKFTLPKFSYIVTFRFIYIGLCLSNIPISNVSTLKSVICFHGSGETIASSRLNLPSHVRFPRQKSEPSPYSQNEYQQSNISQLFSVDVSILDSIPRSSNFWGYHHLHQAVWL